MASIVVKSEPKSWENYPPECRLCMSQESLGDIFVEEGLLQWILDYLLIAVILDRGISVFFYWCNSQTSFSYSRYPAKTVLVKPFAISVEYSWQSFIGSGFVARMCKAYCNP